MIGSTRRILLGFRVLVRCHNKTSGDWTRFQMVNLGNHINIGKIYRVLLLPSLKLTYKSPLKIGRNPKGKDHLNQPSIFRCELLVSGRVYILIHLVVSVRGFLLHFPSSNPCPSRGVTKSCVKKLPVLS